MLHVALSYTRKKPYLWVKKVGVDDSSLDVIQVGVMLECPLEEASFLAQLGDVSLIVVGEHLVA